MQHRISLDRDAAAVVVVGSGELDAYAADELAGAFAEASGEDRIVVDLTSVSFMDSTVLGLIVRAVRDAERRGGAVRVVLPQGTARRIFEITTLDRLLPVSETREEAVSDLG